MRGAHSFGGPENRFGAPRAGHIHQGQDVLTAEGTPDVAPLAGTIVTTANQPGGAGYYVVEHTLIGFDFMFAHCEAGSFAVAAGQAVAAGPADLQRRADRRRDRAAPALRDVGRRLAGRGRAPDRPAALPGSLGKGRP